MLAFFLGAFFGTLFFERIPHFFSEDVAWTPAIFSLPPHQHLIFGGLAFGAIFMATDPVSSPSLKGAKWAFGILCGFLTIFIRLFNPVYAEGVMLAILIGNAAAPFLDHIAAKRFATRRRRRAKIAL